MLTTSFTKRRTIVVAVLLLLLLPGLATSLPTGIGGQQNDIDDVAKEGVSATMQHHQQCASYS